MKHTLFVFIFLICAVAAQAEGWQFDFILENDAITPAESLNDDRYYTNGIQLKLKSPSLYEFSLGQLIFTPSDKKSSVLISDDRPYAGFLFISAAKNKLEGRRMQHMQLSAGVVGSASMGEQVQNGYHSISSNNKANGWDHQLENEPTLMFSLSHIWSVNEDVISDNFGWNLIPYAGINLGSPYTSAVLGGELRLGYRMAEDYTIPGISFLSGIGMAENENRESFSGYLFIGMDGSAVLWNTFLDGNVFRDSHSVDKKPFVASARAGFVLKIKKVKITYTQVCQTKEFYGQEKKHTYGSLQIGYLF